MTEQPGDEPRDEIVDVSVQAAAADSDLTDDAAAPPDDATLDRLDEPS